jgi:hypothetical protein
MHYPIHLSIHSCVSSTSTYIIRHGRGKYDKTKAYNSCSVAWPDRGSNPRCHHLQTRAKEWQVSVLHGLSAHHGGVHQDLAQFRIARQSDWLERSEIGNAVKYEKSALYSTYITGAIIFRQQPPQFLLVFVGGSGINYRDEIWGVIHHRYSLVDRPIKINIKSTMELHITASSWPVSLAIRSVSKFNDIATQRLLRYVYQRYYSIS